MRPKRCRLVRMLPQFPLLSWMARLRALPLPLPLQLRLFPVCLLWRLVCVSHREEFVATVRRQPGHDKRRCSILGSGRSNPNVNAINVVELLPHARIRAAPFDAPAPAHDAGEMAAERDDVAEEDSVEGDDSAASGSGSGSEADEAALEGFASEGVQWHMVYDSTQPTSDSNR